MREKNAKRSYFVLLLVVTDIKHNLTNLFIPNKTCENVFHSFSFCEIANKYNFDDGENLSGILFLLQKKNNQNFLFCAQHVNFDTYNINKFIASKIMCKQVNKKLVKKYITKTVNDSYFFTLFCFIYLLFVIFCV